MAPTAETKVVNVQIVLRDSHRHGVRNLVISDGEGGVELSGDALSFHAMQLVIRDVLAAGLQIQRNRIRVRTGAKGRAARSEARL